MDDKAFTEVAIILLQPCSNFRKPIEVDGPAVSTRAAEKRSASSWYSPPTCPQLLSDGEASGSSKESGSPLQEQGHDHRVAVRKAFPADRTTVVFSQPQKIAPEEKTVFSDKQEEACAGPALVSSNSDRA